MKRNTVLNLLIFLCIIALPVTMSSQTVAPEGSEWKVQPGSESAFLGITTAPISREKAEKLGFDNTFGYYVSGIIENTAAEAAGLQPFDYVYGVDEYRTGEEQSLGQIISRYSPGQQATIHLVRDGKNKKIKVELGSRNQAEIEMKESCKQAFLGVRNSHLFRGEEGVRVEVIDNSTAAEIGMRDGDIIKRINGHRILDWTDLGIAMSNTEAGSRILVEVWRGEKSMEMAGDLKSLCVTKEHDHSKTSQFGDEDRAHYEENDVRIMISDADAAEKSALRKNTGEDIPDVNTLSVANIHVGKSHRQDRWLLEVVFPQKGDTKLKLLANSGRLVYTYDLGPFSGPFSDEFQYGRSGRNAFYLLVDQDGNKLLKKIVISK
ncbi:MAG: PDZ domain-containing protein [Saprospiraceae bacterium]|nr:PDZ domain-containing protein [Saprospiraceae bacterium]